MLLIDNGISFEIITGAVTQVGKANIYAEFVSKRGYSFSKKTNDDKQTVALLLATLNVTQMTY